MKKGAKLYKELGEGRVRCLACNHYCEIDEGAVGICGIRQNIKGKLYLLNYGKLIFVEIDPIEKKPLYHFYPGAKTLSISELGCNFKCSFCQNWDTAQFPRIFTKEIGREQTNKKIMELGHDFSPKEVVEYAKEKGLNIISYTYNEPAISVEYYLEIMKVARKNGIKNVWVTNGYFSKESFKLMRNYIDAVNIDMKAFDDKFYRKHCGAKLQPVLDNIKRCYESKIWVEVTTLVIPGENDSKGELERSASFISSISKNIPWHISRFSPCYRMLDKNPTCIEKLEEAREIGKKYGLKYCYIGNIECDDNTYCNKCGALLIERDYYKTEIIGLEVLKGVASCQKCKEKVAGIF